MLKVLEQKIHPEAEIHLRLNVSRRLMFCMQMNTDECRHTHANAYGHTQTHADARRCTQMHADANVCTQGKMDVTKRTHSELHSVCGWVQPQGMSRC